MDIDQLTVDVPLAAFDDMADEISDLSDQFSFSTKLQTAADAKNGNAPAAAGRRPSGTSSAPNTARSNSSGISSLATTADLLELISSSRSVSGDSSAHSGYAATDGCNNRRGSTSSARAGGTSTHRSDENNSARQPASRHSDDENFEESFSGSLEDLVNSFDDKISHCFKNYTETTEDLAPVQIRTQEEIMNECQIWWTLTGNFGNILPLDWSKSHTRKLHLPALHLRERKEDCNDNSLVEEEESDEELRAAFDMHSLIVSSLAPLEPLPQTADQVIEEIDELMQESSTSERTGGSESTVESGDSLFAPSKTPMFPMLAMLFADPEIDAKIRETTSLASSEAKLQTLPHSKLLALQSELESLIQIYNETLVQELALRDELEFEKELKNTFISLILNIQNKRRQFHLDKKRKGAGRAVSAAANGQLPQFCVRRIPPAWSCAETQPVQILNNWAFGLRANVLQSCLSSSLSSLN